MAELLVGKVAVVTGAAGGIGRAACVRFAQEGASVAAVDMPGTDLEGTVAAVTSAGGKAVAIPADVTRASQVESFIASARSHFGGVDVLFNNAGIEGYFGPSTEYPEEVFDRVLAVNVKGVWLGIKYGVPALRAGRRRDHQHRIHGRTLRHAQHHRLRR
jgi:NAD(P)-dependent dehydrogenase (short-subunit alcohol dehydrogenase family)